MTVSRTITFFVAAVTGAALLTACGDDDAISKEDFLEQANAICQATNDELEPVFDAVWEGLDDLDPADPANENVIFVRFAEAMRQVAPIAHQQADDLRALGAPDGDEELLETLLGDFDAAIDDFTELTARAADGDEAAMAAMDSQTEDPLTDIDRRAREYGLTVCGER